MKETFLPASKNESQATFCEEVGRRCLIDALTNILNNFKDVVCQ